MDNEQQANNVVENVETPATNEVQSVVNTPVPQQQERLYTKEEVVNLMKQRVNRSHQAFFNRYKVKDLDEMDTIFNDYGELKNNYSNLQLKLNETTQLNAFLRNNIEPNRYDDIKAYFKGKDIEFSEDELINALATHPEWLKPSNVPVVKNQTTIKTLGTETHAPDESDDVRMQKIFGKI